MRDVSNETCDELASRAARSGRSLQEYLRFELIELGRKPDLTTVIERVQARKEATGGHLDRAAIIELKDADRR